MSDKSFSIIRYTLQSYKHYGGNSIVIMITLAAALVIGLMNVSTSLQRTMEMAAISSAGDAHFMLQDVTPKQIEDVKSLKEVEWAGEYTELTRLSANKTDRSAGLIYVETLGVMDGFKIEKGKPPQKIYEVALPPFVAEYLGIEAMTGKEFDIDIMTFSPNNQTEIIPMTFTVSGILQEQEFFRLYEAYYIYVSKEFADTHALVVLPEDSSDFETTVPEHLLRDSRSALVKLKKGHGVFETAPVIAHIAGVESDKIGYNYSYLYASLEGTGNRLVFTMIIAFFMVVGALIIYNAFNIVIAKRTRHFGLLALIGASVSQIKKCVYIEALLNTFIALPLGLLLGAFLSRAVMPLVSDMSITMPAVYHAIPSSYLLTSIIVILMAAAGAVIPARRAGKISPVEAAKFSPGNNHRGNIKIKAPRIITLAFLSKINLLRRKGTGGIIVSLSVVGALFIGISVILFSTYSSLGKLAELEMVSDIKVMQGTKSGDTVRINYDKPIFPEHVVDQISNLDGVTKRNVFYFQPYRFSGVGSSLVLNGVLYAQSGIIVGVDDDILLEYINAAMAAGAGSGIGGGMTGLDTFSDPDNVLLLVYFDGKDDIPGAYMPGEGLSLEIYANDFDDEPVGSADLRISAVANIRDAPAYINDTGGLPILIMPLSSYIENGFDLQCLSISLDIDDSKSDGIIANLRMICAREGNIHYRSFVEIRKEYENQLMSIIILILTGLGIVFTVGMLNLISSTLIGIEQRKKEFGILSALGLGRRELDKMLKLETAWVTSISGSISVIGGCFLGFLFYSWLESIGSYIRLSFPVIPIAIFVLLYAFIPYIMSNVCVRRLLKNTTVELIRQEV